MGLNRRGTSGDTKAAANLGEVTTAEFDSAREAGLSDGEIVEIISIVALNILTNMLGKATRVEIDCPKVDLLGSPLRASPLRAAA